MLLADEAATRALGASLAAVLQPGDVIALSGGLGMGKTSLARGLIEGLGFAGDAPSPTFPIVIPYFPPLVRMAVAHVDLYRIADSGEIEELGLDEALGDGALVIEWAERMGDRLWPEALRLKLAEDGAGRRLTAQVPPGWRARWPRR